MGIECPVRVGGKGVGPRQVVTKTSSYGRKQHGSDQKAAHRAEYRHRWTGEAELPRALGGRKRGEI